MKSPREVLPERFFFFAILIKHSVSTDGFYGEIGMVFDTLHAVSLTTDFGAEVLIHVGLDTVKMNGDGFTGHVKAGDHVKKGDLLLEVDLDKVKAAGYDTITPMLVCNTPDYASVDGITGSDVNPGDDAVVIKK